jgi:molecular chaperone GrpE
MSDANMNPAAEAATQEAPIEGTDLETLRAERDEAQDRLLRLQAEFDNYRKRLERERRDLHEHFTAEILTDFLPVIDDMERAIEAARVSADPAVASHRQGLELILKQLLELLERRGVAPIAALGADFDPNFHQAVGQDVSAVHREGEVTEDMRRGYRIGDRLLRPSMVKVATRD